MAFFLTNFSSECISTVIKTWNVLFHTLNFAHFIFKLEWGEGHNMGKPYIWHFTIFAVLIYGLFCQLT